MEGKVDGSNGRRGFTSVMYMLTIYDDTLSVRIYVCILFMICLVVRYITIIVFVANSRSRKFVNVLM